MASPHNPNQNRLLAALTPAESARLTPHLELVPMPLGEAYCESGGRFQHVYFPTTAIVSLHYMTENGASAEIAGVGNEGVLGTSLFMGGSAPSSRASVRSAGFGYKLKAQILMNEFNRCGSFQRLLLRYTQALMAKTAQIAVCNRHHSIEQQLCRWLLLTLDRAASNELVLTQELAANMLGVRREGITEVAGRLQKAGYIQYRRGHVTVLNRAGLEKCACECYGVIKAEFDRLLDGEEYEHSLGAFVAHQGMRSQLQRMNLSA
ncbi:MAG TPA: Crp/Fnr family transcriptional regulator [Sideroxyarcus sp.]|nr:Crp/Fnr family transcriptional regulator [Sideroxyarcus sp.]